MLLVYIWHSNLITFCFFQITLYGGSSNRLEGGVLFDLEYYEVHPDFDPVIYVG